MALRALSLFSGVGGLDLAMRRVGMRTVCYVEREAYAASVLVARMADASLDPAPVWDDACTFDGEPWRGRVDCVFGGFPCQDISLAGRGGGLDGERSGLWREYARIVEAVRPEIIFIENVPALVKRGLDRVLYDLHVLGFDAEWDLFSAADVGATHRRKRLFVLAYSDRGLRWLQSRWIGGEGGAEAIQPARDREAVAHAHSTRGQPPARGRSFARLSGDEDVADADGRRRQAERSGWLLDGERQARGYHPDGCYVPFPPARDDGNGWRAYLDRWPGLEPSLRRGAHGLAHRMDRLRVLGNAVVPAQAEHAFRKLAKRCG